MTDVSDLHGSRPGMFVDYRNCVIAPEGQEHGDRLACLTQKDTDIAEKMVGSSSLVGSGNDPVDQDLGYRKGWEWLSFVW